MTCVKITYECPECDCVLIKLQALPIITSEKHCECCTEGTMFVSEIDEDEDEARGN